MAWNHVITDSVILCSLGRFFVCAKSFQFLKEYWIKILFVLISEFVGAPLNFAPEASTCLSYPNTDPIALVAP